MTANRSPRVDQPRIGFARVKPVRRVSGKDIGESPAPAPRESSSGPQPMQIALIEPIANSTRAITGPRQDRGGREACPAKANAARRAMFLVPAAALPAGTFRKWIG